MGKQRTWYLHTMDGRPATYFPGAQIVRALGRNAATLVPSRQQIVEEQRASHAWRTKQGIERTVWEYGYVLVRLPEGENR